MKNPEEYIKAFDDWIAQGNRLLKIGDTIFLPTVDFKDGDVGILACVCNNMHTYRGFVPKQRFGETISERKTGILRDAKMKRISLHHFANRLISWDSHRDDDLPILLLFSFDQIDTGQLPSWIVEELMIQKLSK